MKNSFLNFANMLATTGDELPFTDGTYILFTLVTIIVLISLSLYLFIRIRKSIKQSYAQKFDKALIPFQSFVELINTLAAKPETDLKYNLYQVDICNYDTLKKALGQEQLDNLFKEISASMMKIAPWGVKVGFKNESSWYVLLHADKNSTPELISKLLLKVIVKTYKMGPELSVKVNINIASVRFPEYGKTFDKLNSCIDIAMVKSKRLGDNNFVVYSQQFENEQTEAYQFYQEIKNAIKAKEFILHYQPIVDTNSGEVISCEAFIRWLHKERGVLNPSEFLSIMEQTGDIYWVGLWCLEQLLSQYATWTVGYEAKFSVRINLSTVQLQNSNLFDEIRKLIRKYKIDPTNLYFEVEDMTIYNASEIAKDNIDKLVALGVKVCLDNFGLKLTSPTEMQNLNLSSIKLGKSFWKNADTSTIVKNMIKLVVDYAKEENLQVIAHGVETKEDIEYLRSMGINYMQGYAFAKPKDPGEFIGDVTFLPWSDNLKSINTKK